MRVNAEKAAVKVPATSANLGPGYDSFGLALDLYDQVEVRAVVGSTRVEIIGEGADSLPTDDRHLIVRALRFGLEYVGASQVGIQMRCVNKIPQARGMGSSAAAIIAGLGLARGLIDQKEALTDQTILRLATEIEGHPDNLAPALYGGVTVSGIQPAENSDLPAISQDFSQPFLAESNDFLWAVPVEVSYRLQPTVFIPSFQLETKKARSLLPKEVAHVHAAANAARSGLLVRALQDRPDLLMVATQDFLHQDYRREGMPPSLEMMYWLRSKGIAAVISGAGPSVIALSSVSAPIKAQARESGWDVRALNLSRTGLQDIAAITF